MTNLNVAGLGAPSTWPAELTLEFARNHRGTRLITNRHQGPLYVQRPFYPEGKQTSHVYILHPPGGLVSGDRLAIDVTVGTDAQALLTTPGAGRVYRARPDLCLQHQTLSIDVKENAVVEWLPLETIIFNGARTRLDTEINLSKNARVIAWEVTSLGLPANGTVFQQGRVQQSIRVNMESKPVLLERLLLDADQHNPFAEAAGYRSLPVNGFFLAGPFNSAAGQKLAETDLQQLREAVGIKSGLDYHAGLSLVDDFLVGRYLGTCSEQGRKLFTAWWQMLRPKLINLEPCHPRIWST